MMNGIIGGGFISHPHIRNPMKASALTLSLIMILVPLAGCSGTDGSDEESVVSEDLPDSDNERIPLPTPDALTGRCDGEENETSTVAGQSYVCKDGKLEPLYSETYESLEELPTTQFVPSCNITASEGMNATANPQQWPEISSGAWLEVEGLSSVYYEDSISPSVGWSDVNVNGSPESNESEEGVERVVSTGLDWGCGYEYEVKVPVGYDPDVSYPVMMFLHGGVTSSGLEFYFRFLTGNFYMPADDRYIIVQPAKKEVDWDPKKALDVLEDVKSNMNVNDSRVYLTGLSMGGRGTFIIAAALPDYFAALMPLSPHHDPFPYTRLAEEVSHLPIWMSHGDSDNTSSYEMAAEMADILEGLGAEIEFRTVVDGEHEGWFGIYIDPVAMGWILSKSTDAL